MNKIFIGIDPGVSGAIAFIKQLQFGFIILFKNYKDHEAFIGWEPQYNQYVVYLESVHSMPKQGVKSTFTFGENNGWWKGHLDTLGIQYKLVTPQSWKKAIEIASGITNDKTKEWSIQVCKKLFPELDLGKNHNKADALCIAYYAKIMEG